MKLKKSFFNKALFKKNLTLYSPVWIIYTLFLLCMHPIFMWIDMHYMSRYYSNMSQMDKLSEVLSCLYTEPTIVLIACASVVTGMCLYGYLYNHKSANMIHALPVDRNQLFGTNVISGLLILIIPLFLSALSMTIVAVGYNAPGIEYIWYWFLLMAGTAFAAFSIVTFCAMFTGHMAALPVYVIIVNFLSMWAYYLVYTVIVSFGYGVNSVGYGIYYIMEYFSPLACFTTNVEIGHRYDGEYGLTGGVVNGGWIVVIYVVVAIVMFAVAYITYQKRQIEKAGDFITVEWLKPVFRWGAGVTGGILGGVFIRQILINMYVGCNMFAFICIMLFLGASCYFVADMLIKKTVRVFKKKNCIGCAGFSVVLLLTFFGLNVLAESQENYVPEATEVKSATIYMGYEITLYGEDAKKIIELHKQILEHNDYCEEYQNSSNRGYEYYEYVNFSYMLETGERCSRNYIIPYEYEPMADIVEEINTLQMDPEVFLSSKFVQNYDKITEFGTGWIELSYPDEKNGYVDYYESVDLTSEQVKELYYAVIADTKAGTLMKYNIYSSKFVEEGYRGYTDVYLELEFKNPNKIENNINKYEEYSDSMYMEHVEYASEWYYSCIYIGPDCENVVNLLIEYGIIESVDDIYWGSFK